MARFGARVAAARRAGVAALAEPFAAWLEQLGGGAGGELRLETSPADVAGIPEDGARGVHRAVAGGPPPARDPGGPDPERPPPRRPLDRRPRRGPAPARGARASSARPRWRCCSPPATTCAPARRGRSCCWTTSSASSTRRRRRLLLEAVRDGGQTLVTSADPTAADALGGASTRSCGWTRGASMPSHPRRRRRRRGARWPRPTCSRASAGGPAPPRPAARWGAWRRRGRGSWAPRSPRTAPRALQPRGRPDRRLLERGLGPRALGPPRGPAGAARRGLPGRRPSPGCASRSPTTLGGRRRGHAPPAAGALSDPGRPGRGRGAAEGVQDARRSASWSPAPRRRPRRAKRALDDR